MKERNHITVAGWMVTRLGLSGNDLLVYALIYGFSQDGNSVFSGTARYIAEWCNIRKETALQILKRLTDNGLVEKRGKVVNGVQLYDYVALVPNDTPVRNPRRGGEEIAPGGGEEIAPYIDNTNIDNTRDNYPPLGDKSPNTPKGCSVGEALAGKPQYSYLEPALQEWLEYKKQRKERYKSPKSLLAFIKLLDEYGGGTLEGAMMVINTSFANNWRGIFPLKVGQRPKDDESYLHRGPKSYEEGIAEAKKLGLM